MQQARRRLGGAAPAHAPALAAALAVALLAATLPGAADAAPAWLFPLLAHGGNKPLVIEGVACPAAVVDVPTSAAFPPAPWAASATYRLTTAGAEYLLPNSGGPLVIGVNVTVCVVGTRATLRSANDVAYFVLEGGALGLSGVTLRGNGTGPNGVRSLDGAPSSTLGVADASFERLFAPVFTLSQGSSAAFRNTRFVDNAGGGVRAVGATLAFRGDTLFANNVRTDPSGAGGAVFATQTTVVFEGPARFLNNSAPGSATALYCLDDCSVRFLDDAVFEDNNVVSSSDNLGVFGTILVYYDCRLSFEGARTRFARNSVGLQPGSVSRGAGVYGVRADVLFASKETEFVEQEAFGGGGVFAINTTVRFTGGAVRSARSRATSGAFVYAVLNASVDFGAGTTLDVDGGSADDGQVVMLTGSRVNVQSRTARFANNVATRRGGAFDVETNSTLTFGPATRVTLADNVAGAIGGAVYASTNATVIFEGGACITNNSANGGGAFYTSVNSSVVFKDPPAATAGGGGCGLLLPHPFLAGKLCPAAPLQQVMGGNAAAVGPAALVSDGSSAIVCASNGLTRGEGAWAIEGPVCGQACVAGGGNCSCPAGQPFSAADCACKAPTPAWPFPHPWLFGGKAGGWAAGPASASASASAGSSSTAAKSAARALPTGAWKAAATLLPPLNQAADLARVKAARV